MLTKQKDYKTEHNSSKPKNIILPNKTLFTILVVRLDKLKILWLSILNTYLQK